MNAKIITAINQIYCHARINAAAGKAAKKMLLPSPETAGHKKLYKITTGLENYKEKIFTTF